MRADYDEGMSERMTDQLAALADRVAEFDPSDAYHCDPDLDARAYYAAIDRVLRLLRGEITDWKSPPRALGRDK